MGLENYRVCLIGGDRRGWALDTELALTRRLLNFATFTNLFFCNVIHTIFWPELLRIPNFLMVGKKVISHLTHDPAVAFPLPGFKKVSQLVDRWVVRSTRALEKMQEHGFKATLIPHSIDTHVFYPISKTDSRLENLQLKWNIPKDRYLVGSFQRDTEGKDLKSPKLVKGPDIFAEILSQVYKHYPSVHVVLAGPRRFWLRQKLLDTGIPFSYIGKPIKGDDLRQNTLPKETVNLLYNLVDLYIVSSRMEGGPQAILEAAATKCKIISTRVGHAEDILDSSCLFDHPSQAVDMILEDIRENTLSATIEGNWQAINARQVENLIPAWKELYRSL